MVSSRTLPKPWRGLTADDEATRLALSPVALQTVYANPDACRRRRGATVIHVKHDGTRPESPFRPGQEGNVFLSLTAPLESELVVTKKVHSAFIGTDLAAGLQAMAGGDAS